ncbi:hypothetical protein VN0909_11310 [Helicobacter pylori]|nr:hypothetical protein VN0899_13420 [Helicobacter pylori]
MKYHNFLQTLKIQKSPMKKFHFRHQKIIHHYIKYVYGYFKREIRDTFDRYLWHGYSKISQEKRIAKIKEQNVINQKKRVALKESSQLIVEVPKKALDLENVDELVKSILLLNNNLKSHVSEGKLLPNNNLKCYISEGSYIIDLHLIDD